MDNIISNELIAHDLATALSAQAYSQRQIPASDNEIEDFVQSYFSLYEHLLSAVTKNR